MAISQATIYPDSGIPVIEITVPFIAPQEPDSGKTGQPRVAHLTATVTSTGGTLTGNKIYNYLLVALEASKRSKPSRAIEVMIPAGTNTNKVTIAGENPFDAEAVQYEVYRSEDDVWNPRRIIGPASIPSPFTFDDTGLSAASVLPSDDNYASARAYWRRETETMWHLGAQTEDRTQTSLKFQIPFNVQGQDIEIQLRAVSRSGRETPEPVAPIQTYTVTGVERADGVVAQEAPDNRLWNNWFEGTAGSMAAGQPTAPTGYAQWGAELSGGSGGFTGNGEYDLLNHATAPDRIAQDIDWSMVGNPGEDCVLMVEVKWVTSTSPTHDFRVTLVPFDGTSEGTAVNFDFAASNFNNSAYKLVGIKTTLPSMANMTKYRVKFANLSTGGTAGVDGYRIRRAFFNRSRDLPRWVSTVGRDRTTQQVTGGGGGGGGGGVPPGDPCPPPCVL